MDAYNAADQLERAGSQREAPGAKRAARAVPAMGGLDNKLLIVDEAHNFFRAVINSAGETANARRVYGTIMAARNLRLLFLTGTPASKDPFELVPCFNMLAGKDLLPTQYEIFYEMFVDRAARSVRNRERLANRLLGLVSHVTPLRPSAPGAGAVARRARDDGWFPEEMPTVIDRVEMGEYQYRQYLLIREKEEAEGKASDGAGGRGSGIMSTPPLALPGSEKKAMRSYFVRSRTISTFCPERDWRAASVDAMPDSCFHRGTAPKLALIADRARQSPGPVLVYSQFVESTLKPLGRFLQLAGFRPFIAGGDARESPGAAPSASPKLAEAIAWELATLRLTRSMQKEAEKGSPFPSGKIRKCLERWLLAGANAEVATAPRPWNLVRGVVDNPAAQQKLTEELAKFGAASAPRALVAMASAAVAGGAGSISTPGQVRVEIHGSAIVIDAGGRPTRLTADESQLRELMRRAGAQLPPEDATAAVGLAALRYAAALTGGQQLGLPRSHTAALYAAGVRNEAFASPFNSRLIVGFDDTNFCSAFPDTDSIFGSLGPFGAAPLQSRRGAWAVNPPYIETIMSATGETLIKAMGDASDDAPLLAFVLIPKWDDAPSVRSFLDSKFVVAVRVLPAGEYRLEDPAGGLFTPNFSVYYLAMRSHPAAPAEIRKYEKVLDGARVETVGGASGLLWSKVADHPVVKIPVDELRSEAEAELESPADAFAPILVRRQGGPASARMTVIEGKNRLAQAIQAGRTLIDAKVVSDDVSELVSYQDDEAGDDRDDGRDDDARADDSDDARADGRISQHAPHNGEQKYTYALISGEVTNEAREAIVRAFNSPANSHGGVIKAILVSKTGAEGLDLKWLRETHQVEPYWDRARDDQVKARAVRIGSHDGLPREQREVRPYLYIGTANRAVYEGMIEKDREPKTIDEVFFDRANAKYETNAAFRALLAEVCMECEIFGYGTCRSCVPTNAPLFHDDPALDIRLPDPCEARQSTDVDAAPIDLEGATYYYRANGDAPLGFDFFEFREDLGGYAPVDPSDGVVAKLARAVEDQIGDAARPISPA
jgi:hypothetical protein